jgi:hypothetical protein
VLQVGVPVIQLFEQRCCTPLVLLARNHGKGSPLALLASLYMLLSSLPRLLQRFILAKANLDTADQSSKGGAGASASADAGDEDGGDEPAGEQGGGGQQGGGQPEEEVGLGNKEAVLVGTRMTKLLARGLAAKEAAAKNLKPVHPTKTEQGSSTDPACPAELEAGTCSSEPPLLTSASVLPDDPWTRVRAGSMAGSCLSLRVKRANAYAKEAANQPDAANTYEEEEDDMEVIDA